MVEAAALLRIHRRTFERRYIHTACEHQRARYARRFGLAKNARGHVTLSRARVERWRDTEGVRRRGHLDGAPFAVRHVAHRPPRTWAAALAPVASPTARRHEPRPGKKARVPRPSTPQLPLAL